MAGSLPGAATSLKTLFLVKQDKGFCPTKSRRDKRSTTVFLKQKRLEKPLSIGCFHVLHSKINVGQMYGCVSDILYLCMTFVWHIKIPLF